MMDNQNKTVTLPIINEVEGFNPLDFARTLPQKEGGESLFLEVKYRILWFRLHRPNGKIETEVLSVTDQYAVVSCRVYQNKDDAPGQFIAQSCAQRFKTGDEFGDRYLEIAETAAIGRALASAGYGTQFCVTSDLLSGVISDAPIQIPDVEAGGSVHAVHEVIKAPAVQPAPEPPVKAETAPEEKASEPAAGVHEQKEPQTLQEYMDTMTVDSAKKVVVDFGRYAGSTLESIAMTRPADLEWYVNNYNGKNFAVKAGAAILLNAAQAKAS